MGCNCSKRIHKNQICKNIQKAETELQYQKVKVNLLQEALDLLQEQKFVERQALIKYLQQIKVTNIQDLDPSDKIYRFYNQLKVSQSEEYFSKQKIIILSILLCSANPKERARLFWDYCISPSEMKILGAQQILSKLTQFTSELFVVISELSFLSVGTRSNQGTINRSEVEQFIREQ